MGIGTGLLSIAGGKLTGYRKMAELWSIYWPRDYMMKMNSSVLIMSNKRTPNFRWASWRGKGILANLWRKKRIGSEYVGFTYEEALSFSFFYGSNVSILYLI